MHISKNKRCFNVKFSTYYFHMKTKILTYFQVYIGVPLSPPMFLPCVDSISPPIKFWRGPPIGGVQPPMFSTYVGNFATSDASRQCSMCLNCASPLFDHKRPKYIQSIVGKGCYILQSTCKLTTLYAVECGFLYSRICSYYPISSSSYFISLHFTSFSYFIFFLLATKILKFLDSFLI